MPKDEIDMIVSSPNAIRHFEQYMGFWAVHEPFMEAALAQVRTMDWASHIQEAQVKAVNAPPNIFYSVDDGVATIELRGAMTKYGSSLSNAPSSVDLTRAVRRAGRNTDVKSIVLIIDSPGGTVSGTSDLAEAVAKVTAIKPVYAYIEDMAASAAYWVASQATKVYANSSAQIGNIGTFIVLKDISKQEEDAGRKTIVVKAGEFKAVGVPGAPITEEQVADVQSLINDVNALFVGAVMHGRHFTEEQVSAVADGRIHIGANAMKIGLIDGVLDFADVMSLATGKKATKLRRSKMEDEKESPVATQLVSEPSAATFAEIKATCIGADDSFICTQLERKSTVAEASAAWMSEQNKRIELATAKAAHKPGVEPVTSNSVARDDAPSEASEEAYCARVRELCASGMTHLKASIQAAKQMPEAHAAYLRSTNEKRVHHLIDHREALTQAQR